MVFIHAAFAHIFLHVVASMRLVAGLLLFGLLTASTAYAETVTYQHDNNGNITQRITIFGTTTYTYDALNRLISEAGPTKTQSFTYDADGNRLSDGAGVYTYAPNSNHMLTCRGLTVTLDAGGDLTADGTGREFVYNQAGQIAQVKQGGILIASYDYDTDGTRMSKTTTDSAPQGAQTVVYHYDLDGKLIAETTGSGSPLRAYIWLNDTPLSQIEYVPSRKIYYFSADHLNTPRAMMDDTGKVVWRWESDAFGSTLPDEDPDKDGNKFTTNFRFPGQYYDVETGLHYNWHRYYDPKIGRYIQSDPRGLRGGINTYGYALQNPLRYIDPTGLASWPVRGFVKDEVTQRLQENVPSNVQPAPGKDRAQTIDDLASEVANRISNSDAIACKSSAEKRKEVGNNLLKELMKDHPDYPWKQWAPYFEKVWQ